MSCDIEDCDRCGKAEAGVWKNRLGPDAASRVALCQSCAAWAFVAIAPRADRETADSLMKRIRQRRTEKDGP